MSQATCGALLKRLIVSEHLALDRKSHCSRPTIYVRVTPRKIQEVEGPFEKLPFTGTPPD